MDLYGNVRCIFGILHKFVVTKDKIFFYEVSTSKGGANMAFCAYCGKQIPDGQMCDCAESRTAQGANARQAQSGMPMGNMNRQLQMNSGMNYQAQMNQQNLYQEQARQAAAQATQSATQAATQAGNILNETFGHFLLILKAPSTAGSNFVAAASVKASCAMVLIQSIVAGLFSLTIAGKINDLVGRVLSLIGGIAGGNAGNLLGNGIGNALPDLISSVKAFLLTMLMSIIFALLYALLSWVIVGLSKAKTSFGQMFAVSGVRAAFLIPVTIISILVFLISPFAGISVFFVGGIFFSIASQLEALHGVIGINHNTKTYLSVILMIIFCGVVFIATTKIAPQAISGEYLKVFEESFKEISEELFEFNFSDILSGLIREMLY